MNQLKFNSADPRLTQEKLFWIDMEMTGLDVETEVVIEVAVMITDLNFNILDTYEAVVKQDQKYLDAMDDWNQKHHLQSGLLKKIPQGLEPHIVEYQLMDLVRKHFPNPKDRPILAGNSIAQDRLFIEKYFDHFAEMLHYRMLDVSSWKIIFQKRYQFAVEKANSHRALDDIKESIEELKTYLKFLDEGAIPPTLIINKK
jgi:oligoribonuclease